VLTGELLLNEPYSVALRLLRPRTAAASLMRFPAPFWWLANPRGLRRFLEQAGFEIIERGKPYLVHRGPAGEKPKVFRGDPRVGFADRFAQQRGVPHVWFRARPL
jgi:hypothetical protein